MHSDPAKYADRAEAGRSLAAHLIRMQFARPIVLALPRGGAPVAAEIAQALGADLDVLLVRKLGHPAQPELALGAIGEAGEPVLNHDIARTVPPDEIARLIARERGVLTERSRSYRAVRPQVTISGRDAILADDGVATGATMRAAIAVARAAGVRRVIVALPVAPLDTAETLRREVDLLICPRTPLDFQSVGQFYRDFGEVTDSAVIEILREFAVRDH